VVEPTPLKNMLVKMGSSSPIFEVKIEIFETTSHWKVLLDIFKMFLEPDNLMASHPLKFHLDELNPNLFIREHDSLINIRQSLKNCLETRKKHVFFMGCLV